MKERERTNSGQGREKVTFIAACTGRATGNCGTMNLLLFVVVLSLSIQIVSRCNLPSRYFCCMREYSPHCSVEDRRSGKWVFSPFLSLSYLQGELVLWVGHTVAKQEVKYSCDWCPSVPSRLVLFTFHVSSITVVVGAKKETQEKRRREKKRQKKRKKNRQMGLFSCFSWLLLWDFVCESKWNNLIIIKYSLVVQVTHWIISDTGSKGKWVKLNYSLSLSLSLSLSPFTGRRVSSFLVFH